MWESLRIQLRVLSALTIRESQGSNKDLAYGFLWALIDVVITITGLALLKIVIRGFSPPGAGPVLFLVMGAVPWTLFAACHMQTEALGGQNSRLVFIPNVTKLDLVMARAIQLFYTYGSIYFVATFGCIAFEKGDSLPRLPVMVILLFILSAVIGVSLGLVMVPLNRLFPPAAKFLSLVWRLGLLLSGVYFVIGSMPTSLWPYLVWNPMLHLMELLRTYWFYTYKTPVGNPAYLAEWAIGLMVLGLCLDRYGRRPDPA